MALAHYSSLYLRIRDYFKHGDTIRLGRVTGFFSVSQHDVLIFIIKRKAMLPNVAEISQTISGRTVLIEKINAKLDPQWDGWMEDVFTYPETNINYNELINALIRG